MPINISFDTSPDSVIIDSAISHTGNKQIFSYKRIVSNMLSSPCNGFSIDNGKTYHFAPSYDFNRNSVPKYTVTAEELATIYSVFDIQKGQYVVLKDGVWRMVGKNETNVISSRIY